MEKKTQEHKALPRSRAPKYYQIKFFWVVVFGMLILAGIGVLNWTINHRSYQNKAAAFIYKLSGTQLEFENIKFNLFTGEVSGSGLNLNVEKIKIILSLKEFKLLYNPLYFFLGRFRITQIEAKEFLLDTSKLLKDKNQRKSVPKYLQRINLKMASIDNFSWSQPNDSHLMVASIRLTSKFGSTFQSSPLNLIINNLTYKTPKIDLFVNIINMDGFFLFDISKPRIVDESKLSVIANANRILLGIHREPKPWLSESPYDADLVPLLKNYYDPLPLDKTFLFLNSASVNFRKTIQGTALNALKINLFNNELTARGTHIKSNNNLELDIKTQTPLAISKLPLGQSKFRQAFEEFTFDAHLNGHFISLTKHDLKTNILIQLLGNKVQPAAGPITANINGTLTNKILTADTINVTLAQGSVTGKGLINFETLNTDTNLNAKNIEAQTVVRLFSSINIPSLVDATGTISGKVNNPRIALNMNTPNATYEFLNFGVSHGELLIDNKNMQLSVQTTASDIGQATLNMDVKNVFDSYSQYMELKSSFTSINIKKMLAAKNMDGTIGGVFNLKRADNKIKAEGDFKATAFSFFEHTIGDLNFKINQNIKHVEIKPIIIALVNPQKTITSPQALVFDFDDTGYRFSGMVIDGLKTEGVFKKADRGHLQLKFAAQKMNLDVFTSLLPVTLEASSLSGTMDLLYDIQDPILSQMKSNLTEANITTPEGLFKIGKPSGLDYHGKAFVFRNFDINVGQGKLLLNGPLGLENNSNLKITGLADLTPVVDFNPFISESEQPISVDVTLIGDIKVPRVNGKIELKNNSIKFRNIDTDLEGITGTLNFFGDRIETKKLNLDYDDAPIEASGWITTDYQKITAADLSLTGNEVPIHPITGLSLLCDLQLKLKGQGSPQLSGDINIVEGQYNRNFSVTNFAVQIEDADLEAEKTTFAGLPFTTSYDLHFKNTGDLLIKNDIAELEMNAELDMQGTIESPELIGQIDFLGGQINAYGIDFDNATGFAQFKRGSPWAPEVSLIAKKDIQGYNINARIEGKADNLRLRLDSSPALDQREILSIIFYGQTPDQLDNDRRRSFTQTAAISQLANILSDPLYRLSGLDVLQVNSRRESARESVQRLTVGKKLSQRFDLSFTTDLGISDPERAVELRYQVFDNFYLIAAKDVVGGDRYRFDVNFTIEAY